jgi:copper chaperone
MYQLQVENMSCGHCVGAVTRAVQEVDAGAKVEVDLASKTVKVDSSGALDKISAAIAEAGYPVLSAA